MSDPPRVNPNPEVSTGTSVGASVGASRGTSTGTAGGTAAEVTPEALAAIDRKLSQRFIELDPAGYFLIYVDREAGLLCADHYSNIINDKGLACDPETGKPLPVRGKVERTPDARFQGRTAKELGMKITEQTQPIPLSRLDHALYLGRELVRAEIALLNGSDYVQD